jgi:hypothetical protein
MPPLEKIMKTLWKPILLVCFATVCLDLPATAADAELIRVGIYDSRAIAIAYAPSKFNPAREKMRQFKKAKDDGNEKLMKELENWGEKHQRQLHRQGFAFVPVGDLLSHVEDKLPEVAERADVVAITRSFNFSTPSVEVVDVTDELVKLFDPSEKTLKTIQSIRGKRAVDLDELEQHHNH